MRQHGAVKGIVLLLAVVLCMAAGTAAAETIIVGAGKTVDEVFTFGKDIRVYGTVEGDAVSVGGDVTIEPGGTVEGNAVAIGGDVSVRRNAEVEGDVVTVGGSADIDEYAFIDGSIVDVFGGKIPFHGFEHGPPGIFRLLIFGPLFGAFGIIGLIIGISISLVKVLVSVAVAACITYFFPTNVTNMAASSHRHFLQSFLAGFLTVILIPFMLIGLVVTLIGIPLVPVFILFLTVCYLFGSVGIAAWVGELFPNAAARSPMRNAIIGVLVLALVKLVPGIGFLVGILVTFVAFGLVLTTRFGRTAPVS